MVLLHKDQEHIQYIPNNVHAFLLWFGTSQLILSYGLVQGCSISSAFAMGLLQFCTKPAILMKIVPVPVKQPWTYTYILWNAPELIMI